jgi:hypothetical protein
MVVLVPSILLLLNGYIAKDWNILFLSTPAGSSGGRHSSGGNSAQWRSDDSHFDLFPFFLLLAQDDGRMI